MPTVKLNRKQVEKLMGKKLPVDELRNRISMLGTDLERVDDKEIVVEIFPNRPDMLSEQGFARALASFIGVKKGLRKYRADKPLKDYEVKVDKKVKEVRPYTACAIVKGLELNEEKVREIIQIQEKLHLTFGRERKKLAIGIYPLDKIALPIKYTAKKPKDIRFRPLDSVVEMDAAQLIKNHPVGKEYGHLLEGKKRYPTFIDSNGEVLSVPPIVNSHETGRITGKTKEVFIECSGFDYSALGKCLNILVTSLSDMGGRIYSMNINYSGKKRKSPELEPERREIDISYINKILGMEFKEKEVKALLGKMGYGYNNGSALVPCYRADILHQIDIVEDIAIAYGYENFDPVIPNVATVAEEDPLDKFRGVVAEILVGMKILEASSYHLTNQEVNNANMLFKEEIVKIENSLNPDYANLRSWLLPGLMKIFSENTNREYPQNIFELGKVFNLDKGAETGVREEQGLAVALCGKTAGFTDIRQILDGLLIALDIDYEVKATKHPSFIEGRVGVVRAKGEEIAFIGEINPEVLKNFDLEMPVAAFEMNISKLFSFKFGE